MEHNTDFPFEEIRTETGDYFHSIREAIAAGYDTDQIWSVVDCDNVMTYGPSHHYVNLIGYVATNERHDNNTYYNYDYTYDYAVTMMHEVLKEKGFIIMPLMKGDNEP